MTGTILTGKRVLGPESARLEVDGRAMINFIGFNYLALQRHPELIEAARSALDQRLPWSQMGSNGYGGIEDSFKGVIQSASAHFGTESALFLPTGYFCGSVCLSTLENQYDYILIDEYAHFSMYDAARLTGKPVFLYRHLDTNQVEALVYGHDGRPLLLTDGVFATWGSIAPLDAYASLLRPRGGTLVVDDSHGFSVLGRRGRGTIEHLDVEGEDILIAGSLSKGFCAQGAIFPCSHAQAFKARSRPPLRGAGCGSPISAHVSQAALSVSRSEPDRREKLSARSTQLKAGLRGLGLSIIDTPAPITAFQLRRRDDMLNLQRALFDEGILILVSNYIGSGPEGTIRCATFADHSEEDVAALVAALRRKL
ncbi:aminotransferase class I/II-fold pyridoxal phosphate-dependent enzyme [Achromobacter spanius]|uniref:Aminotransferase class I/classII large domain-containing protein n=1 Tax=Achromobacter spanius TaxID=217203 RepID=A0A2S0I5N3_9BURK|nr:pyridoxal phosphate-dependent aminotransferase family protein [Achromobacter spanius]AVJ27341.1 hypothetical protein CLM73_09585 [Achromobacter spanius]